MAIGWFAIKTCGICSDVSDCCCGQRGKIVVVLAELMCCDFSAMLWAVDAMSSTLLLLQLRHLRDLHYTLEALIGWRAG